MEGAGKLWLRHIINDLGGSDEPVGFGSRVGRVHRRFLLASLVVAGAKLSLSLLPRYGLLHLANDRRSTEKGRLGISRHSSPRIMMLQVVFFWRGKRFGIVST
jgi:hypothetical protein